MNFTEHVYPRGGKCRLTGTTKLRFPLNFYHRSIGSYTAII